MAKVKEKVLIDSVKIVHEDDCSPNTRGSIGIVAKAAVSYSTGQRNRRIEWFTSGGLWGIETDSDPDYLQEVEQEQLDDLKQHLAVFGIEWDEDVEIERP